MMHFWYLIGAYFIGSFPTGFCIARLAGIADIRKHGSGNIGATNVARVLGTHYFFLIFTLDFLKAYVYLSVLGRMDFPADCLVYAAVALLIGNGCSLFLGGRGGKGAATTFGVLLALHPLLLAYLALIWFFVLSHTRTVGAATIAILFAAPLLSWLLLADHGLLFYLILFISGWGLWLHRSNIRAFYVRGLA